MTFKITLILIWYLSMFIMHVDPNAVQSQGAGGQTDLTPSTHGEVYPDYWHLQIGPNTTTIPWFYDPELGCVASSFAVEVYSHRCINTGTECSVLGSSITNGNSFIIASRLLYDDMNNPNYFKFFGLSATNSSCDPPSQDFFFTLSFNG